MIKLCSDYQSESMQPTTVGLPTHYATDYWSCRSMANLCQGCLRGQPVDHLRPGGDVFLRVLPEKALLKATVMFVTDNGVQN